MPAAPPVGTIYGVVKLQAYLGSSRMVRFIASAVSGGVTNYLQTNEVNLSFTGGEASYSIEVSTNTTHLSAKTAWHLRKRLPVTLELTGLAVSFSLVLGMVYTYLPFMILPLYGNLAKMDLRLLEAAADLGATPWVAFWTVTVPLAHEVGAHRERVGRAVGQRAAADGDHVQRVSGRFRRAAREHSQRWPHLAAGAGEGVDDPRFGIERAHAIVPRVGEV